MDSIINLRLFRKKAIFSNPLDELHSAESRDRGSVKFVTKMVGEGLLVNANGQSSDQYPVHIKETPDTKGSLAPDLPGTKTTARAAMRRFSRGRYNGSVDKELADAVKQSRHRVHLAKAGQQMKCSTPSEEEFVEWAVRWIYST